VPAAGFEEEVSGSQRRSGQMKRMRTKILGGASIAAFAVAATLAFAPAAHAEAAKCSTWCYAENPQDSLVLGSDW
jgi:hypothetical protein